MGVVRRRFAPSSFHGGFPTLEEGCTSVHPGFVGKHELWGKLTFLWTYVCTKRPDVDRPLFVVMLILVLLTTVHGLIYR